MARPTRGHNCPTPEATMVEEEGGIDQRPRGGNRRPTNYYTAGEMRGSVSWGETGVVRGASRDRAGLRGLDFRQGLPRFI
jgi:hypothetical protein